MSENVIVETSLGSFHIALDHARAPRSVENFLRYVDAGHYSETVFHRVIASFMVQGGGYDTAYNKKPTQRPVESEADNGLENRRGTVAMARTSDPHSATAQFFVNVVDNGFLNHQDKSERGWGYTVFGQVAEGMDVVDAIRKQPTGSAGPFAKDAPLQPVLIHAIRRA